jgi:hypothetical protein
MTAQVIALDPQSVRLWAGQDRRRHPRRATPEGARVLIGYGSIVFCDLRDLSAGGACLRLPGRFSVRVGERLTLASGRLGGDRHVRVVDLSDGWLRCSFETGTQPR